MMASIRTATRRGFATNSYVRGFDGAIGNTPLVRRAPLTLSRRCARLLDLVY